MLGPRSGAAPTLQGRREEAGPRQRADHDRPAAPTANVPSADAGAGDVRGDGSEDVGPAHADDVASFAAGMVAVGREGRAAPAGAVREVRNDREAVVPVDGDGERIVRDAAIRIAAIAPAPSYGVKMAGNGADPPVQERLRTSTVHAEPNTARPSSRVTVSGGKHLAGIPGPAPAARAAAGASAGAGPKHLGM